MNMRQYIAYLAIVAIFGSATMGHADDKKPAKKEPIPFKVEKTEKPPVKVQKTNDGTRAIYVPKGSKVGGYVEGGGKQATHDNPKGEKRGGVGIAIPFGGSIDKKKNGSK
jgi:hypothetical protein